MVEDHKNEVFEDGYVATNEKFEGGVTFEDAEFHGDDVRFDNADFLTDGSVSVVDGNDVWFDEAEFLNSGDVSFADVTFANEGDVSFERADFLNSGNVIFSNVTFENDGDVSFEKVDFERGDDVLFCSTTFANSGNVIFEDADFLNPGGVYFEDVNFKNGGAVRFKKTTFTEDVNFCNAFQDPTDVDFAKSRFEKGDLEIDSFEGFNLSRVKFIDVNLGTKNFKKANLEWAMFLRTDLRKANFTKAKLHGTVFDNAYISNETVFGDHYLGEGDSIGAATWTYAQIERLYREAALPRKVRSAITERKDRRRRHYWHNSIVPNFGKRGIHWLKSTGDDFDTRVGNGLRRAVNWIGESSDKGDDTNEYESPGSEDTTDKDDEDPPYAETKENLSTWDRLVNTGRWVGAAATGVLMRYGESTKRVQALSIGAIGVSALAYSFLGLEDASGKIFTYGIDHTTYPAILGKSLYFSMATFTTIGGTNLQAVGWSQTLATIESFAGPLLMGTLVWVLGRQATR